MLRKMMNVVKRMAKIVTNICGNNSSNHLRANVVNTNFDVFALFGRK
jgi:hypothetical protein